MTESIVRYMVLFKHWYNLQDFDRIAYTEIGFFETKIDQFLLIPSF
jgi:hypothetical protein